MDDVEAKVASAHSVGLSIDRSAANFRRALRVFPDGITRATIRRTPYPMYVDRGEGAYLFDVDGNKYLDLANNFTALIHGHAFPPVVAAIQDQAARGTCFGNPTTSEIDLAELILSRIPSADLIRFCNTGTEAVMHALKAARSKTGRRKIAKIEGAYHGSYDWAEVSEGSSPENWGDTVPSSVPNSRHVPRAVLDDVIVIPFNQPEDTLSILRAHTDDLAAILLDVMPSRAGLIPATREFLDAVELARQETGALIISDEVLNFRMGEHGAAEAMGLKPDLITLGKIIGGGLPIGAICGSREAMSVFAADRFGIPTPQSGTFSANPMSMRAGFVSMTHLKEQQFAHLDTMGDQVRDDLTQLFTKRGANWSVTGRGSLFRVHPRAIAPRDYREAFKDEKQLLSVRELSSRLVKEGVALANGGLGVLSTVMKPSDIDMLLKAFRKCVT